MGWFRTVVLTRFVAALLVGSAAFAQGKDSSDAPPAPPVKNPLEDETPNPLTDADPFAGEYEGDEVIVIIKVSGDGYVGEIRRAGRPFALKAVRQGEQMVGTFTHESTPFKFTAQFDGPSLKLASGSKVFLLKRKGAAAPAPQPVPPQPPTPLPTPQPSPPQPTPKPPTPAPVPVTPPPDGVKLKQAGTPLPVDYTKLTSQQLADVVWTRFPAGAFVVIEETASTSQALGSPVRKKHVIAGATGGVPSVSIHRWTGKDWDRAVAAAPTSADDCKRPDELGFTKGQTREETITIAGKPLACQAAQYSGEVAVPDGALKITLEVWRARGMDHPPIMVDMPARRLLVEPDVVRVKIESEYKGLKATMDLSVESQDRQVAIGNFAVTCTVIKGVATNDQLTGRSTIGKAAVVTEYWLSHQVPGGVVKKLDAEEAGPRRRTVEKNVVEFHQGK